MDRRSRLELAGGSLMALLDPDFDLMPTGGYEVAHDLGRWWDAVLRLVSTIGFVIPAVLESAIHWDMVCDLGEDGEIWVDDQLLYK
ncbi:MAG: hypothetical protein QGH20_06950, partial [Candidatus Latescibacteria bacterium]|nr:hypothetical protein [Candidatus Latescibacterota bacterium]